MAIPMSSISPAAQGDVFQTKHRPSQRAADQRAPLGRSGRDNAPSDLIRRPRSAMPDVRSLRQIGGSVNFAQVEDQSRCLSERIREPGFRSPNISSARDPRVACRRAQVNQFWDGNNDLVTSSNPSPTGGIRLHAQANQNPRNLTAGHRHPRESRQRTRVRLRVRAGMLQPPLLPATVGTGCHLGDHRPRTSALRPGPPRQDLVAVLAVGLVRTLRRPQALGCDGTAGSASRPPGASASWRRPG